jgi:hypothetical protein
MVPDNAAVVQRDSTNCMDLSSLRSDRHDRRALPASAIHSCGQDGRLHFGFLEHVGKTRFPVPKTTYFVTPGWQSVLQNQAISRAAYSKTPRIRA